MNPKVSILVPIYGVEKFIERCAISLFEQTFQDIEYIFVNDCTPDNSIDILKNTIERYPNRKSQVKIINHEKNKGLAGARNTGVENASGDYILHVDSDDYLELKAIELLYRKAFEENADIVVSDYFLEWNNISKYVSQVYNEDKIKYIELILSGCATPCVWNKLFKRSLYTNNNISIQKGVNFGEDLFVTPKLFYYANKIVKLDTALLHYIQFNTSSYTKKTSKKNIDDVIVVLRDLTLFFENKDKRRIFLDAILRGKLSKKMEFIQQSNKNTFDVAFHLFPETSNIDEVNFLSKQEKILYRLVKLNNKSLVEIYLKIYSKLFYIVQKLKRR